MDILCCFFSDFIFFDLGVSAHPRAAHFRVIFLRTFIRLGQMFLMAALFLPRTRRRAFRSNFARSIIRVIFT